MRDENGMNFAIDKDGALKVSDDENKRKKNPDREFSL